MLRQAVAFLLETVFNLFILAALVRFWMQALRAPARNPLAQFTLDFVTPVGQHIQPHDSDHTSAEDAGQI